MNQILTLFTNQETASRICAAIVKHLRMSSDQKLYRPVSGYKVIICDFRSLLMLRKNDPQFRSGFSSSPYVILYISKKNALRYSSKITQLSDDIVITPSPLFTLSGKLKRFFAPTRTAPVIVNTNDENYHYMFEHNPEPMWIYEMETLRFLDVNKAACYRYGYTKPEFLSMSIGDIRPAEDVPELLRDVKMDNGDYNPGKLWCHVKKNGERIYVEISSHKLLYHGRDARHVIARDVTQNLLAQNALAQSEQNFRKLFQDNLAVLLLIDPQNGAIVDANASALRFYGYSREQMLALKISDINTLGKLSSLEIQKVVERQQIYFTFQHRLADGSLRDVEVFSSAVVFNNKPVHYSIIHDISDKRRAEEKIHLLSKAIEQTPLSIIITDLQGKIEYVNPGFTSYSGYSSAEVLGRSPSIVKSGTQDSEAYRALWSTITSNKAWVGEVCNKNKNGDFYWVKSVITPVIDPFGKTTHYLAVQEDITEQKRLYDELVETKERAEEMNRLKTSFLNNMSHELRTPMIGIIGFSEYLKENLREGRMREMADTLHASSLRLSETLNLILTISQLEAEKLQIASGKLDICEISRGFIGSYHALAERKNLQLKISIPQEHLFCRIDEKMYEQCMHNLLNNAFKYTKHGTISLNIERVENTDSGKPLPVIQISVSDTGIGIPEENLELIFDEFRQSSEGLGRIFEGTGLGLSITKKFVEKMDGFIRVRSKVGSGSVFTISFPEVPAEPETVELHHNDSSQLSNAIEQSERPKDVLLVDDDPNIYEILQIYCGEKIRYHFAQDEDIAIELATKRSYDAVFLDINLMSDVSGLDLLEKIRNMSGFKSVPFVAITAYASDGERELFLSSGFDFYLSKPFNRKQLWDLLEAVFR